ncbi:hypothetical protein LSTR_LSTR013990 [Laodelphax striatellus]|uniref:Uncharacterized protein n=1 Tax=Laodelphax striatellus TaxID=195883 RepID=A0A482WVC8_LAOST|nr:hypothetical protein LSTR_LSTR013990 [Laodelphax striatellus]
MVLNEKLDAVIRRGRPRARWIQDVERDLITMGIRGSRRKAGDRTRPKPTSGFRSRTSSWRSQL